jgi:hypothetical protein
VTIETSFATSFDADLLHELFDYAGLFPPAQHPLPAAVAEYRRLRSGPWREMVGPFLVKSSLLAALERDEWRGPVGVIADTPWSEVVAAVCASTLHVVQAECAEAAFDAAAAAELPPEIVCAVELSTAPEHSLRHAVQRVAIWGRDRPGVIAKVRTGGVTPGSTLPDETLTEFMVACRDADVRWKATAGLHQPLRHHVEALRCDQHGFLNVLAAAWAVDDGADAGAALGIIRTTSADRLPAAHAAVRTRLVSIGSCSIEEPVGALQRLGLLREGWRSPQPR